jgi:hypothetical protein
MGLSFECRRFNNPENSAGRVAGQASPPQAYRDRRALISIRTIEQALFNRRFGELPNAC